MSKRKNLLAPIMFHRYPGYFRWFWHEVVLPYRVRKAGITLLGEVSFAGYPIISMAPDSSITIGQGSTLCSESPSTALCVNHPIVLRTLNPGAAIKIGNGVRMSGTSICAAISITIKDNVCIGSNVVIADTDFHSLYPGVRASKEDMKLAYKAPVVIEHDVFIGAGAYILKGVTIGQNAIIGASAVVTKSVPAWAIVMGNPAQQVGELLGKDRPVE